MVSQINYYNILQKNWFHVQMFVDITGTSSHAAFIIILGDVGLFCYVLHNSMNLTNRNEWCMLGLSCHYHPEYDKVEEAYWIQSEHFTMLRLTVGQKCKSTCNKSKEDFSINDAIIAEVVVVNYGTVTNYIVRFYGVALKVRDREQKQ